MNVLHTVRGPRVSQYTICQEAPGYGLIWVRSVAGKEIERSGGAFYDKMGAGWHPSAMVACMQGVRAKCAKVRRLLRP